MPTSVRVLMLSLGANALEANLGGERERLAEYANRTGMIVQVSLRRAATAPARFHVTPKYVIHAIPGPRWLYPVRALRLGRKLIGQHDLTIVDTQEPVATGLVGALLKRWTGVRLVIGCHSLMGRRSGALGKVLDVATRAVARVALRQSDGVQAVSYAVRRDLIELGVPAGKIAVIPVAVWPVDGQRLRQAISPALDILYVGRLSPEKNPALLVRAILLLQRRGREVRAGFVGDGPELDACRFAATAAVPGSIEFLGVLSGTEVAATMAQAKMLVLPSASEGFGRVLVEAANQSLPVVATSVGAVPEIVVDGVTGLLVAPNDDAAMADAIDRLLSDSELRTRMGNAARDRAQREYGHEVVLTRLIRFWESVVAT